MPRRALHTALVLLTAVGSMGLQCGWGTPLEGLATHCPPRTIDCGPGCIEEGTTCCDDTSSGGKSQCATAGGGIGKKCVKRGEGSCAPTGPSKFCCGEASPGLETPSKDIDESSTFNGSAGVFCGNTIIRAGAECCSAVDAKKICRLTSTRTGASGSGGGGGSSSAGGGGGTPPSCSTGGPGWMGSARSCQPLGAGGSCSCSMGATNRCITKAEFDAIGRTFPAACKPAGQSGCLEAASGTLIAPCCPGLSCKIASACGSSASGGSCIQ